MVRHPSISITTLAEPFDDQSLALLKAEFRHHVKAGRKLHVIDLDQLGSSGSCVIRALVTALRIVREVGGEIRLVSSTRPMQRVLTLTALNRVFPVYRTVHDAVAAHRSIAA